MARRSATISRSISSSPSRAASTSDRTSSRRAACVGDVVPATSRYVPAAASEGPKATEKPACALLHGAEVDLGENVAKLERDVAACEAEHVHYWEAMPGSVRSHRQAAAALRAAAEALIRAAQREDIR